MFLPVGSDSRRVISDRILSQSKAFNTMKPAGKIMALRSHSQSLFRAGEYQAAIDQLIEAWELLPQPREMATFSNVLAGEIAESYLEDRENYAEALRWADVLSCCHQNKIDSGEAEYLKGRIYYEMGRMDEARTAFTVAMQKSEGRCFEGAGKYYLDFLKKAK